MLQLGINGGDDRSCLRTHLRRSFENIVVPHMDAAFNDARRLTRNSADAEDVVQEAVVRAFRFVTSVRTDNVRSWLFTIVRRTWYARVAKPGNRIPYVAPRTCA